MEEEVGEGSWTTGGPDRPLKHGFKRRRKRRCQGLQSRTLETPPGNGRTLGTAEHPDNSSHGTENQNLDDQQRRRLTACCAAAPRTQQTAVWRSQLAPARGDQVLQARRPSVRRASWALSQKSALVQLHELQPGLQYQTLSRTGPGHAPLFSVGVEVHGRCFEGQGSTKRQAKRRAAESALGSFIQLPNAPQAHAALAGSSPGPVDFTADRVDAAGALLVLFDPSGAEPGDGSLPGSSTSRRAGRLTLGQLCSENPKVQENLPRCPSGPPGPVDLLTRRHPGLRWACLVERGHGSAVGGFLTVLWVEGRVFEGRGRSKRLAKTRAAATALQALYRVTVETERKLLGITSCNAATQLPQLFSEAVFDLVREKYAELTHSWGSTSHARHKGLAGVVMTRGFSLQGAQVVALGSGTRCLSGGAQRDQGWLVNDCHAEVMARRALVGFLYTQLELFLLGPRAEAVERAEDSVFREGPGGVFRLKEGLLFHMFVSSSPCGDARLHCPYGMAAMHLSGNKPARRFHCRLRMKTAGGEGTLPVRQQPRANQDGGMESPGKPLITMSCTDKIARWSVLGLQGALLSQLVEPVYLFSLTVGGLGHTGHLARTLACRTARLPHLALPYRRTLPRPGCVSGSEPRPGGRSPDLSLNWTLGAGEPEELSTSSGQRSGGGGASRLCRRSLFARWRRLQQQLKGESWSEDSSSSMTYSGSKMEAGRYQSARRRFDAALRADGLGPWPGKPPELSGFSVGV